MTGTIYRLLKERRKEGERISSAGGKQSAWSKVGMGLGGLLAMGLTGGAATPLVAAMMAGGGTLAGGLLGRGLARGTKGGRIDKAAGRFYGDEAKDLISQIGSSIWTGAGKSFLGAGLTSLGGSLSLGKEGLKLGKIGSVGKDGAKFNLANLLDKGKTAATAPGTYSDSLWGKLGEAIDYKGSFIGKGLDKFASRNMISSIAEDEADDFLFEAGESAGYGWKPEASVQGPEASVQGRVATEAPIVGGDFDADRYRILKENEALRKAEYLDSLAGSEGVLEPLSYSAFDADPVIGTGQGMDQDIMGALMEGYNTPTGQGYDPGDAIYRQQNRGAFMDELALGKDLDSRLGRTFGLPSTTRGYDFRSIKAKKHRDTLDSMRWQNRLFGD